MRIFIPTAAGGGSGTVTSVVAGTGLTGGTITTTGTVALALPAASTIGGVFSKAVVSHNFLTGISSVDGSVSAAQPAVADLSDGSSGTGAVVLVSNATLIAPALGTPASGVATNLTGTAASLTAGTVTTNANLTGPITSVGNATSVAPFIAQANTWSANQTVQGLTTTSPGWYAQLTGDTQARLRVGLDSADGPGLGMGPGGSTVRDTFFGRAGAANSRFGAADAAAPIAQTISVQNVVTGTSNTAGANTTFMGSQGTGTGVGGSLIFQVAPAGLTGTAVNALATALTIDSTKLATFTGGITVAGTISSTGGNLSVPASGIIVFNARAQLTSPAANQLQVGPPDNTTATSQTIGFQNVATGNSNVSGADATIVGSRPTGSGTPGQLILATGFQGVSATSTVTISNASPAVISWSSHGLSVNQALRFSTTGGLPTGLSTTTTYYVIAAGFGANSFEVSATQGGSAVNTSSAGSGTQTALTATVQQGIVTAATVAYTGLKIASGLALTLGNAATTGLTPGVLAASTNASIVITDSAGQAYRIPCII